MIEFKQPNSNNLRETLRLSNKMLKTWYLLNLREHALNSFKQANATHLDEYEKLIKSQKEVGAEQTKQLIESSAKKKLFSDFVIYLYALEKDDSDIQISSVNISEKQTKAIKEILAALKNIDQMTK